MFQDVKNSIISFLDILKRTLNRLGVERSSLFKTLGVPVLLLLVIEYSALFFLGEDIDGFSSAFILFSQLVSGLLYIVIAIFTHRVILRGRVVSRNKSSLSGSQVFIRFVIRVIWFYIIISIFCIPIFSFYFLMEDSLGLKVVTMSLGVFLALMGLWVVARLSLIFPSIAIGKGLNLTDAWNMTEGHKLLMFLVINIFPILLWLGVYWPIGLLVPFGVDIVYVVLGVLFTIFEVAILSISYDYIVRAEKAN